ncbi:MULTISPECIES: amidohydrolase family protein [Nonomuraea]|uniref:Amidohydrolase family protein n=1 Tax=Nonomuraea ferruginea TaxID=46174 RepID=A0ABT4TAU2_9ACTN|nr:MULTISPECIES: amidohydrolase family protein [Nonomuraea]MDA0646617.1 amidohydrolase family protein [Nonomuraea ferruginea]TXK34989.1 amidohydrolase [Nonomuraea sp. C10]
MTTPLLPDPEPRRRDYVIISADDHLIEPPDLFEDRVPEKFADVAPKVVETEAGHQVWRYGGATYPCAGLDVGAGLPREQWTLDPVRFENMRPGCYDIEARVKDMDTAGVWAALCFPGMVAGQSGMAFARTRDQELGLALVKAYNDWHIDVWAGTFPERIIGLQLPWLPDPDVAAKEIRANAARGFKAVVFPEFPTRLRLPSIHSGHWDPFFAACEETGTVVALHTGASSWSPVPSPDTPIEAITTLMPTGAMFACADWLWSGLPLRFPNLRILIVEGGVGWLPMLADRADYALDHPVTGGETSWEGGLKPSEVLRRNFFFGTLNDHALSGVRLAVGLDHVLQESGYPHSDSTWPDTQKAVARNLGPLPPADIARVAYGNAARLFGHPLPSRAWLRMEEI